MTQQVGPRPKTLGMQVVELRLGRPIEDVIREWHYDDGLSQQEVAARLGLSSGTLSRWMERLGIPVRPRVAA